MLQEWINCRNSTNQDNLLNIGVKIIINIATVSGSQKTGPHRTAKIVDIWEVIWSPQSDFSPNQFSLLSESLPCFSEECVPDDRVRRLAIRLLVATQNTHNSPKYQLFIIFIIIIKYIFQKERKMIQLKLSQFIKYIFFWIENFICLDTKKVLRFIIWWCLSI